MTLKCQIFYSDFKPVLRYTLNGTLPWEEMTIRLTTKGNSQKTINTNKYSDPTGQPLTFDCPATTGNVDVFQIRNLTAGLYTLLGYSMSTDRYLNVYGNKTVAFENDKVAFAFEFEKRNVMLVG